MSDADSIEAAPQLGDRDLRTLLAADDRAPCISIYIDTQPAPDGKDEGRIRYKDQVKRASDALDAWPIDKRARSALIEQLEQIGLSEEFWIYQQYGLAVFLSAQRLLVRKLMARPGNQTLVADAFHLRPALQISRDSHRHHVLCVSAGRVALHVGDGRTLHPVTLHPEVPVDMSSAIGEQSRLHKMDADDRGGDDSNQVRRYFQRVDQAIWRHHSRDAGLPLLLAALSEHQGLFREVSENGNLLPVGLDRDPFHGLDEKELARLAWEQVRPALSARIDELLERFNSANAHQRGSTDPERIGQAAANGQVAALLLARDEQNEEPARDGEVLDRLARLTLRTGGEIWFIPAERMPATTGAAAVYRFST